MGKGAAYNQRARAWLAEQGYVLIAKVEWFNPFTKRMTDLFGAFDYLAVGKGETVGVQVTSRNHASDRRKKLMTNPHVGECWNNGWRILLLTFDQPKGPRTAWRAHVEWLLEDDDAR